jgi:hypothetical protein
MQRREFLKSTPLLAGIPLLWSAPSPEWWFSQDDDASICSKKFELAVSSRLRGKPINEVVIEMGKSFLGTEYVAHTLEQPGEERLVINMRGLDCVSFCENSLVFARCIKKGKTTFDDYKAELQFIRYRGGVIDRYPSRLHYFSDYIFDNEKKGVWKNVTKSIGGVPFRKTINFMSTHPDSYPQLKEHPEFLKTIQEQEAVIGKRALVHIPTGDIEGVQKKIQSGDVLAITTDIPGMDIAHTGIAIRQGSKLHFMHAPLSGSKVVITTKTLAEYLTGNKRQLGIMVARPLEP